MSTNTQAVVRILVMLFTLVNFTLNYFGKNPLPFSEEQWYTVVSAVVAAAATLYSAWKNNSFTKCATLGDRFSALVKAGNLTAERAEEILAEIEEK